MEADQLPFLGTFVEAAERGSFTAAANALRLTQAAVSQHIQQLEHSLGTSLFRREGGRISLTTAGRILHDYARRILALHQEARTSVTGIRPVLSGELLLGQFDSRRPFTPRHPGCFSTTLRWHRSACRGRRYRFGVALVEQGRLHIGLVGGKSDSSNLEYRQFASDRLVVVVRPTHPWHRRRRISVVELVRQPLVLREGGSGSRAFLERALAACRQPVPLTIALELGSNEAVKKAVSEGVGVAVLSQMAVQRDVQIGDLHALDVTDLNLDRPIYSVTDPRRALPPSAQLFLSHLDHRSAAPPIPTAP